MAVLDASFIVKLVVNEECSEEALKLYQKFTVAAEELHIPCIAFSEVVNAIWKHYVLLKDLDRSEAEESLKLLQELSKVLIIHDVAPLLREAFDIAAALRVSVYDSIYLALARKLRQPLYTFDKTLREKVKGVKELESLVIVPRC